MIRSHCLVRRLRLFLAFTLSVATLVRAQTDPGQTTDLLVYNVVTQFSASNTGVETSTQIQNAINAALAHPGVIYFPAGTYKIGAALTGSGGAALSMAALTFRGSGVGSTTIEMYSGGSLTVTAPTNSYHAGAIEDMTISCAGTAQAGLIMQDAVGIKVRDVLFSGCPYGVEMQDVSTTSTRNDFDEVSFSNCSVAVLFENNPGGTGSLFTYNRFRIWVNGTPRIFTGYNGPTEQKGYFNVMGTAPLGTVVFDAHTPSSNNKITSMLDNTYFVKLQSESTGSGTSYIFDTTLGGGTVAGEISGVADVQYDSSFLLNEPGSKNSPVAILNATAALIGTIPIGSGASDVFTSPYLQAGSICYAAPHSSASGSVAAQSYFANPATTVGGTTSITFYPPASSSGTFNVFCSQPHP